MKNPKRYAKKNQKNKVLFFFIILPLLVTGFFFGAWYKITLAIEERDYAIYMQGYEQGYWDGGEAAIAPVEPKITPVKASNYRADKDTILKQLAQIESGNGKHRKILDTNGRYSLGLYHFQGKTVVDMYRRYYGKKITIQEAVAIAQDDTLSKQLAHDAIFVKGEKFHWKISLCKMEVLTKGCLTQKQINSLFAKK